MKYGLSDSQFAEIISVFLKYPEIEEAVLFGSRAIDTFKEASDVDIAIKGKKANASLAAKIKYYFEEETYLPFFFDIVSYSTISNKELKKHIDSKGVSIFKAGMSEWKECKLGDVVNFGNGKVRPQEEGDIPVYGGNGILYYGNDYNYDGETIIIGRVGAYCGSVYYENRNIWVSDNALSAKPKDNNFTKFFYYYLSYLDLNQFAEGSSHPLVTQTLLNSIDILLPPLQEQKAIANILSSLDDKIDLLHRQNKTLEAMAEALFRQWFKPPDPLKGEEKGWEEGKLGDEFNFTMGQSPLGSSFNEDKIGAPMFQGNADFGFRFPTERVYTTKPTRFAEPLDTLISVRAPVGEQNMALVKCCIGRGVAAFRYNTNNDFYTYTYFKLRSLMTEIKQFNDEGTVFGSIGKADFEALDIIIPPQSLIHNFEKTTKPINDKVIENCKQISTLEKLRDTLLPKLMSGEVRVAV